MGKPLHFSVLLQRLNFFLVICLASVSTFVNCYEFPRGKQKESFHTEIMH